MKNLVSFLSLLFSFIILSSCGSDDNDGQSNNNPTYNELSIEPYFKYVGLSLDEIQKDFTTPLIDNKYYYYIEKQWIYNQIFDARFSFDDNGICTIVGLKREDDKTTTFEHFKLYTREAFLSLGEPKYAAVYKFINFASDDKETLFEVATPHKKGAYEETVTFAEKNNISKVGHSCEMIWEKNNHKIRYRFSTQLSEIEPFFNVYITSL